MSDELEWVPVSSRGKAIGAIGFIDNKIHIIYSAFACRDFNRDGKVGVGEWVTGLISPVNVDNLAFVEVAQAARIEEAVYTRDSDIEVIANRMALHFFANATVDGALAAWLSRSLGQTSAALAPLFTKNLAKQFVFRKGMEAPVKRAWRSTLHQDIAKGMPELKAR